MRETGSNGYKRKFMDRLEVEFPGCMLLLLDSSHIQGVPDLLMLWGDLWAAFEVKAHAKAKRQPNQPWYVDHMHQMSFAAFVYPENEEAVLHDLKEAFASARGSRIS